MLTSFSYWVYRNWMVVFYQLSVTRLKYWEYFFTVLQYLSWLKGLLLWQWLIITEAPSFIKFGGSSSIPVAFCLWTNKALFQQIVQRRIINGIWFYRLYIVWEITIKLVNTFFYVAWCVSSRFTFTWENWCNVILKLTGIWVSVI